MEPPHPRPSLAPGLPRRLSQRAADLLGIHPRPVSRAGQSYNEPGLLVPDQAGGHRSGTLDVPPNLSLLYLPPYSPEPNPAERLWEDLREKDLSKRVYETVEVLMDQLQKGWQRLQALCRCSYLN